MRDQLLLRLLLVLVRMGMLVRLTAMPTGLLGRLWRGRWIAVLVGRSGFLFGLVHGWCMAHNLMGLDWVNRRTRDSGLRGAQVVGFDYAHHVWNQFCLRCNHCDTDIQIALSGEPAFRLATEVNEVGELKALRVYGRDLIQSIVQCQPRPEDNFIGLQKRPDGLRRRTMTLQTDLVHAAGLAGMAVHDHERRHILHDLRTTTDDRHLPDPAKLMHRRQAADDGVILHNHVPSQSAVIAKDDMIADDTIVRNVRVCEKVSMRTNPRMQSIAGRGVNGRVFPENIVRPDVEVTLPAGILKILRFQSDAC